MNNKLTDLVLCQRIAEIEGELAAIEELVSSRNKYLVHAQRKMALTDAYNPLTKKKRCFLI